jgi:hypothetical protein
MLVVNDVFVTTPTGLSAALVGDWAASRELMADGAWPVLLAQWVEVTGDTAVLGLTGELAGETPDHRVARLASFLDPHRTPVYAGRPLTRFRLRDMAARSAHEPFEPTPGESEPDDREVVRAVLEHGLLSAWAASQGFGALRQVEDTWRAEVEVVLGTPASLAGADRPSAAFTRGILLIDGLGELTTVCPVCGEDAADPATTCRLVLAMAALGARPPTLGAGAALLLWSTGRQRQALARRANDLDAELALARVDNEPAAADRRTRLERARWWVGWGVASLVVVTAFGLGVGRRGALIGAIFATVLALLVRHHVDEHHAVGPPPPEPEPAPPTLIDLVEQPPPPPLPPEPEPTVDDPGPALHETGARDPSPPR